MQMVQLISPLREDSLSMGMTAIGAYLAACVFAWMAEPYRPRA